MTDNPMKVAVIGAGKMGLPLACVFASRGAQVTVCDVNRDVVDGINRGICPFDEPGVSELLATMVGSGSLRATSDTMTAVSASEVVVVLVPVLLTDDNRADLSIIDSIGETLSSSLRRGAMVSVETTLPVGGTRRLGAIVERGGLRAGTDFDLVFSPERVKSRLVLRNLKVNPKVVGGITPAAAARAEAFYAEFLGAPVDNVGTLEAAEFVKLAGMVYRDVNIALANELATYAEGHGIDFSRVREAANTDGEAAILLPGIGVGGHCTPVYPYFLINEAAERGLSANMALLGREINDFQTTRALDRIESQSGSLESRRVLVLGLGFRPDVKEHTLSPAFQVCAGLQRRGAQASVFDPLYTDAELRSHGLEPGTVDGAEVAILVTGHNAFSGLLPVLAAAGVRLIFDGRAFWSPGEAERAGLGYLGVGLG